MVISNAAYVGSILGFETKPTREHYLNKSAKKIADWKKKSLIEQLLVLISLITFAS